MNMPDLVPILAGIVATIVGAYMLIIRIAASRRGYRGLMAAERYSASVAELRQRIEEDESGEELDKLRQALAKERKKSEEPSFEEKLFRAGVFSVKQKADFKRLQVMAPLISMAAFALIGKGVGDSQQVLLFALLGLLVGLYLPFWVLNRRTARRQEEILFYLPLVIEQVSIGVSSSLDIGPCLVRIVQMAEERDTHNPVTELLRYAQFHIKSGASLEEALTEAGQLQGQHDLKHAFLALSQVAKHGGEISKQLQDLADSVAAQREAKIDEKIKKLELAATGPVALVFFGFLTILLIGFGLQISTAMNM